MELNAKANPPAPFLFSSLRVGLGSFAFRYDSVARRFHTIVGIDFVDQVDQRDIRGRLGSNHLFPFSLPIEGSHFDLRAMAKGCQSRFARIQVIYAVLP